MKKSENIYSPNMVFNRIYIEESALDYSLTNLILNKYIDLPLVYIKDYKQIMNRKKQNIRLQRTSRSLVLAVKKDPFFYELPEQCQKFGYDESYYTSLIINCLFNCDYCFLQGMYCSTHILVYVNHEEIFSDITTKLSSIPKKSKNISIALSYDSDLLLIDKFIPYFDIIYDSIQNLPNIDFELRTKSVSTSFHDKPPLDNLIIAYTLTPKDIADKYEPNAPSAISRLNACKSTIEKGFRCRICFDPIFIENSNSDMYIEFFHNTFKEIPAEKVNDIAYGFFRMPKTYYKRMRKLIPESKIMQNDFKTNNSTVSYNESDMLRYRLEHLSVLKQYFNEERIFVL